MNAQNPPAIVFDAYGTLFDVYSVSALAEQLCPGFGSRIAEIWRVAQIDYTRLRTLCGKYEDFGKVTADALDFAIAKLELTLPANGRDQLLAQYDALGTFPEVPGVLDRLKRDGCQLAILSNGTPEMLSGAVNAAGMQGVFDHLLSVDRVRRFKTAPEAYQLGPDAFGRAANRLIFVSSNGWDICGATWFGYKTFWVNRAGNVLEKLDVSPNAEGQSLTGLLSFVASA